MNIVRQAYSHYETGRNIPTNNSIFNLARLYRIPADVFFSFNTTYYEDGYAEDERKMKDCKPETYRFVDSDELNDYLAFTEECCDKKYRLKQKELIILYYARQLKESYAEILLYILKALKRDTDSFRLPGINT